MRKLFIALVGCGLLLGFTPVSSLEAATVTYKTIENYRDSGNTLKTKYVDNLRTSATLMTPSGVVVAKYQYLDGNLSRKTTYNPSGIRIKQTTYNKDRSIDTVKYFWESGKLKKLYYYSFGKKAIGYQYYGDGQTKLYRREYDNLGTMIGKRFYDKKGVVYMYRQYWDGEIYNQVNYDPRGRITYMRFAKAWIDENRTYRVFGQDPPVFIIYDNAGNKLFKQTGYASKMTCYNYKTKETVNKPCRGYRYLLSESSYFINLYEQMIRQ